MRKLFQHHDASWLSSCSRSKMISSNNADETQYSANDVPGENAVFTELVFFFYSKRLLLICVSQITCTLGLCEAQLLGCLFFLVTQTLFETQRINRSSSTKTTELQKRVSLIFSFMEKPVQKPESGSFHNSDSGFLFKFSIKSPPFRPFRGSNLKFLDAIMVFSGEISGPGKAYSHELMIIGCIYS